MRGGRVRGESEGREPVKRAFQSLLHIKGRLGGLCQGLRSG